VVPAQLAEVEELIQSAAYPSIARGKRSDRHHSCRSRRNPKKSGASTVLSPLGHFPDDVRLPILGGAAFLFVIAGFVLLIAWLMSEASCWRVRPPASARASRQTALHVTCSRSHSCGTVMD
jgi:hypothetical protein